MITSRADSNWVSIAERASIEMDDAKLGILIKQLCCALDACHGSLTQDQAKRDIEQIVPSSQGRSA